MKNMIKRLFYKIRNRFKKNPTFWDKMMEDWGKEDVYGPWTKPYKPKPNEPLKFYKSYYMITTNDKPNPLI